MAAYRKAYIVSHYHNYAKCALEARQPEKAAAIRQRMDYLKIPVMEEDTQRLDDEI